MSGDAVNVCAEPDRVLITPVPLYLLVAMTTASPEIVVSPPPIASRLKLVIDAPERLNTVPNPSCA